MQTSTKAKIYLQISLFSMIGIFVFCAFMVQTYMNELLLSKDDTGAMAVASVFSVASNDLDSFIDVSLIESANQEKVLKVQKKMLSTLSGGFLVLLIILFFSSYFVLRRFKILEKEIEKTENELKFFSKQIAHDLVSPLTAFQAIAQSSKNLSKDEFSLIHSACQRLQSIVYDIKNSSAFSPALANPKIFNQFSFYQSIFSNKNANYHSLCLAVESLVEEKLLNLEPNKKIRINTHFESAAENMQISFDLSKLLRILSNVIQNSMEAIDHSGNIHIHIAMTNHNVLIQVQDNGRGIPSQLLQSIFKEKLSSAKKGGMGIGLYDAKQSIEAWGGKISISSILEQNTIVRMELPNMSQNSKWQKNLGA